MAKHTCALDIPVELSQLKFRDAYGMGLPIIVPAREWMERLLLQIYWHGSAGQLHAEWAQCIKLGTLADVSCGRADALAPSEWPQAPFFDPRRDSAERLKYWLPLADHLRYPHVVYFDSFPAFFDKLLTTSWAEVSVRMRAHHRRVAANSERFFQASLAS